MNIRVYFQKWGYDCWDSLMDGLTMFAFVIRSACFVSEITERISMKFGMRNEADTKCFCGNLISVHIGPILLNKTFLSSYKYPNTI
jgi:Ca2+/H+ antiporter